jgi:hypothetical protein
LPLADKYCKTCKNFKDEDADGYGWCELQQEEVTGYFSYPCHEPLNNGWTKITQDNKHLLTKEMINKIVLGRLNYKGELRTATLSESTIMAVDMMASRNTFYYFVLPELKIE